MLIQQRHIRLALVIGTALLLAGCIDTLPDASVGRGDIRNAIATGTMTSPRGATVAMASFEGAPSSVASRFNQIFAKEAADREIAITDPKSAHYLIRGYLSAYPSEQGTEVAYVYDVFDAAQQRRIERVNDVLTVPGSNPDAWALLDDRALASLAGHSADDLAVALAAMPEARAATAPASTASAAPHNVEPKLN